MNANRELSNKDHPHHSPHPLPPYPTGSGSSHGSVQAPGQNSALPPALRMRNLTKVFSRPVVTNLSLDIPRGSFYGIVGPNGAGKTTAITMATGLLEPTSGNAWVAGHPLWEDATPSDVYAAKQSYGLLADGLPVFDRLTAAEYLQYLGALRKLPQEDITRRSSELLAALDLTDTGNKKIVDFSAGMTKKILLAGALIHSPEVLILDEPFEAVDPVSAQVIKEILRQFVRMGGTVIISSHVMELVEGLCSHVAIIAQGQVRAAGTLDEVRAGIPLNDRFVQLVGARHLQEGSLNWLRGAGTKEEQSTPPDTQWAPPGAEHVAPDSQRTIQNEQTASPSVTKAFHEEHDGGSQ